MHTPWKKSRRAGVVHGGRTRPKLTDALAWRAHSLKPPAAGQAVPVFLVGNPSRAFYFPVTPHEVQKALEQLPSRHTAALTHVWFRRVRKRDFERGDVPLAELVRGSGVAAVVLYPWPRDRQLHLGEDPVPPALLRFYEPGQPEIVDVAGGRALQFSEEDLRRFHLEHLLLHEVGHLVDSLRLGRRNAPRRSAESYADDYAIRWSRTGEVER